MPARDRPMPGHPRVAETTARRKDRDAQGRAGRDHPRAQLPASRNPGYRRQARGLARSEPLRRLGEREDDHLLRRSLHGRDGGHPLSRENGHSARADGGLPDGGHDVRGGSRRAQEEASRRGRRHLRELDRRGEGRDGHLLHLGERGARRRVGAGGKEDHLRPRQISRRLGGRADRQRDDPLAGLLPDAPEDTSRAYRASSGRFIPAPSSWCTPRSIPRSPRSPTSCSARGE